MILVCRLCPYLHLCPRLRLCRFRLCRLLFHRPCLYPCLFLYYHWHP
jgi:hypothetical protein